MMKSQTELLDELLDAIDAEQTALRDSLGRVGQILNEVVPEMRDAFYTIANPESSVDERTMSVEACVRCLQFDDIVRQILEGSLARGEALTEVAAAIRGLAAGNGENAELEASIEKYRQLLAKRDSVGQHSIEEGDIELF